MAVRNFTLVDADSHIFEPPAIWERYLDGEYRVLARSVFWYEEDPDGLATIIVNGKPAKPMNQGVINRQAIWRPGMTPEQIGALDPKKPHPINPGAQDPERRLKDMDALGVDKAVLFPTLFAEYFPVVENPDVAYALSRAYNSWVHDWCRANPDRLLPAAVLPLQDIRFAIREAERVSGLGFKAAFLRPSFFQEKFLTHPSYDPLWKRLEVLGLTACIHPSPGNANPEWTSEGSFVERVAANLQIGHNVAESVAPMMDNATAFTAFAFCGQMENFPKLKVMYCHGGASWLHVALEKAENYLTVFSYLPDITLEQGEVFFDRPSMLTFDTWEAPILVPLQDLHANVTAWGSRYPNHDATPPSEAIEALEQAGASGEFIAKVMGANAARLYGL